MTELTPGQLLAANREQRNLSHEDIARKLRLSVQTIKDLEKDIYAHIGVRTFVRGYLCGYARLVGLSEAIVLDAFQALDTPAFQEQVIATGVVSDVTQKKSVTRFLPKVHLTRVKVVSAIAIIGVVISAALFVATKPIANIVAAVKLTSHQSLAVDSSKPQLPHHQIIQTAHFVGHDKHQQ